MYSAENLIKRHEALVSERALIEPFYECAAMYFDPLRKHYWSGTQKTSRKGINWNADLYSSAGIISLNRFSYFLQGNATPSSARWMQLQNASLVEMDTESVQWFADCTRIIEHDLRGSSSRKSSFYMAQGNAYKEMAISYGVTWVYEGEEDNQMSGEVVHQAIPSHAFYYQLDEFGHMAVASYSRQMTNAEAQIVLGKNVVDAENEEEKHTKSTDRKQILQMVFRNSPKKAKVNPRSLDEFPYMEYWVDVEEKRILRRKGYRSQPFHVDGWHKVPNSNYFVGPVYDALPDMVTAAAAKKSYLAALQMASTPPLLGGKKITGATRTMKPGRITWGGINHEGRPTIQPLNTGQNPQLMIQGVQELEANVRSNLGNDEMVNNITKQMTAQEAFQRSQERAAMVAPYVTSVMPSLAGKLERHFEIKNRTGGLPPVPEQVANDAELDIQIIGPLAMAARQVQVGSMMQSLEQAAMIEQMQFQLIDQREAVKKVMDNAGHLDLVRDFAEVDEEIKAQQQALAQQQEAEVGAQQAQAAKTGMEAMNIGGQMMGEGETLQ